MATYTEMAAKSKDRELRARYKAMRQPGVSETPDQAAIRSEIDANANSRRETVRSEAAAERDALGRVRRETGYVPPNINDPTYIAAVKARSNEMLRLAGSQPGPRSAAYSRAAANAEPFMEASGAAALGTDRPTYRELRAMRGVPSDPISAMNERDAIAAATRAAAADAGIERRLETTADNERAAAALDVANRSGQAAGQRLYDDAPLNGRAALAASRRPLPIPAEPTAPGGYGSSSDYVRTRDAALAPIRAERRAAEAAASREILDNGKRDRAIAAQVAAAESRRPKTKDEIDAAHAETMAQIEQQTAEIGLRAAAIKAGVDLGDGGPDSSPAEQVVRQRELRMRSLQERQAIASTVATEKAAGIESPESPDYAARTQRSLAQRRAALASVGTSPEAVESKYAEIVNSLGSSVSNYSAIIQTINDTIGSLPPEIRSKEAAILQNLIVQSGANKRTLVGRALDFAVPGRIGQEDSGIAAVMAAIGQYAGTK